MHHRRIQYFTLFVINLTFALLNAVSGNVRQDALVDSSNIRMLADSAQSCTDKGLEYYYSGNFDLAEKYLQKSLDIYQNIYKKGHRKIGITYINLGAVFMEHWKYNEAMNFLDKAEENLNLNPEKYARELGGTFINKGIVYSKLEDLTKAKMMEEMALKILLNFNDSETRKRTINLYNILASINIKLREYQEGIDYYLTAEKLAFQYNPSFLHVIYGNLGSMYSDIGNFQKSEYYYKKSIGEFSNQSINQPFKLARIYSNYAGLCLKYKMYEETYRLNRQAFDIVLKHLGEKNPIASDINNLFGQYFEAKASYDSALYYYQRSICSLFNDFDDLSVYANPGITETISKIHLLKCLKDKANAFQKYYKHTHNERDLQASLESYDLAVKLIDEIRMGYQDEESKIYLNENERITYDEAISTAYMMWKVTGNNCYKHTAFEYSEKSKASVLLSALRDAGAKSFGGIPDSLLKQESDLARDIAFYNEQLYEEKRRNNPDSLKIDLWERKLFRTKEFYDDLISMFGNNYPGYYALKYQTGMIAIEEIQKRIQKDASLLEYSLTDSVLYTFLIGKDCFEMSAQPLDSVFQSSYDTMLETITYLDPTRHHMENFNQFVSSSFNLYKHLIKPLVDDIKSLKLIIIPDGELSLIPFEALISEFVHVSEGHLDYKDLPFLLKRYAISYGHSSTTLFEKQFSKREKGTGGLLAFAPSYNGANKLTLRGTPRYSYRKNLASIPGAREEVEQIIRLFRGEVFMDKNATELTFKKHAGDYDILHLAMHAVINNQNPMYSKLVFSATSDSTEDDLLNTLEIYSLNLKARMVVVSSCSSGEGILQKGEGVISLARGFSYAGCPSLVMTLWEVEDKVSVDLMVGFYKYLKKGFQKDIALQKAKLDFLSDHPRLLSHPFYWSAYQCIGDISSLRSPAKKYLSVLIFAGVAIVVFALYMKRRRFSEVESLRTGEGKF